MSNLKSQILLRGSLLVLLSQAGSLGPCLHVCLSLNTSTLISKELSPFFPQRHSLNSNKMQERKMGFTNQMENKNTLVY